MKKYLSFLMLASLVLSFSVASIAKAEDGSAVSTDRLLLKDTMKEKREEMKGERDAFREKMQTERKAFMDTLKTERETFKADLKVRKEEFKGASKEKKKEFWENSKRMIGERFGMAVENLTKIQL